MAFRAVFSKCRIANIRFRSANKCKLPVWLGRTAVYLIKGPDSDGPKIHMLFRDSLPVDPVDVRPDVGDQAL